MSSASTRGAVFAGLDGDGDLDLALATWAVGASQGQFVLQNDGSGHFVDATAQFLDPTTSPTTALAAADLDADGDRDLVVQHGGLVDPFVGHSPGGGAEDLSTRVLTNLTAQLEAPRVAVAGQRFDFTVLARGHGTTGSDAALLGVSLGGASIPVPGLGVLGIDPGQMLFAVLFAVPRAAGEGTLTVQLPGGAAWVGFEFYAQSVVLDPALAPRLSNRLRERVF